MNAVASMLLSLAPFYHNPSTIWDMLISATIHSSFFAKSYKQYLFYSIGNLQSAQCFPRARFCLCIYATLLTSTHLCRFSRVVFNSKNFSLYSHQLHISTTFQFLLWQPVWKACVLNISCCCLPHMTMIQISDAWHMYRLSIHLIKTTVVE